MQDVLARRLFRAFVATFACALLVVGTAPASAQSISIPGVTSEPSGETEKAPEPPRPAAPPLAPRETNGTAQARADRGPRPAFSERLDQVRAQVERLPLQLERVQKSAQRLRAENDAIQGVRVDVETLEAEAGRTVAAIDPLIATVREQLAALGEQPKEGDIPETEALAAERAELTRRLAELTSAQKATRLVGVRASQLLSRLQTTRHKLLARDLLERGMSPLSSTVWDDVSQQWGGALRQLGTVLGSWGSLLAANPIALAATLVLALMAYLAATHLSSIYLRGRFRRFDTSREPLGFIKRTWLAGSLAPAFAAPAMSALGVFWLAIYGLELNNRLILPILAAVMTATALFIGAKALTRAVLLPGWQRFRLVGVDDRSARHLYLIVSAMAAVSALDLVLTAIIQALFLGPSFLVVAGSITNAMFAVLLVQFVMTRIADGESTRGGQIVSRALNVLKIPTALTALVIVAASLGGYLTLGRFISSQVMLLGCGGVAAFLLHRSIASFTDGEPEGEIGPSPRAATPADATSTPRASTGVRSAPPRPATADAGVGASAGALVNVTSGDVIRYLLNALILVVGVGLLLLSWGFSTSDLSSWMRSLVVGFTVGGIRISPAQILGAIVLFAGLLVVTRLIQRWLMRHVFERRQVDAGLANSIHTGVGYAGTALALLVGISYAGLDVTNLAIVAGALSVGIGFGLQSIVNNFVSGLILLVERPFKVGDWIVVGEHQGYVRRISVRATEIETFDRASLILPNSELISGAVQNWTHRNAMGRIVVNVGVTYSADPAEVMKILKSAADSCGVLLQFPQPLIVFENFGDSALEFSVRGYVGDVNTSLSSKTKLRVAIAEGLKANGIEIPFPQQDIHLRDLDGFKTMVARATGPKVDPSGGEQTGPQPAASPSKVRDREPAPAAGAVAAPASDASAKPQPTTTPEPPRVAFPDLPRRRA